MDRSRLGWLLLVGGLMLGLGSGWAAYVWLETQRLAQGDHDQSLHPVLVATRNLPRGIKLTPDDVRLVSFPDTSRPDGALESVEAGVDRMVLEPLRNGEPVLDTKLGPADVIASPVALRTPQHKRAYAVRLQGPAGQVTAPGDRIDLLVTVRPTDTSGGPLTEPTSRIVVEQVPVLDVLRAPAGNTESGGGSQPVSPSDGQDVILEVTPEEAERVALAEHEGTLRAVLRHPTDTEAANTPGVSQSRLLGLERPTRQAGDPQPRRPHSVTPTPRAEPVRQTAPTAPTQATAAPSTRIEVIRGGQRSEVAF
ncbi:MAG: Flp pilus assembly protein CpaB [Nitrospira sp.]|nr:Flp pilus assembly protein CpaB [Nitrospira sp.]